MSFIFYLKGTVSAISCDPRQGFPTNKTFAKKFENFRSYFAKNSSGANDMRNFQEKKYIFLDKCEIFAKPFIVFAGNHTLDSILKFTKLH